VAEKEIKEEIKDFNLISREFGSLMLNLSDNIVKKVKNEEVKNTITNIYKKAIP